MLKLYKRVGNEILYWETWQKDEKTGVVHWGVVGQRGDYKEIKSSFFSNFRKEIQKQIDKQIEKGYAKIEDDDLFSLIIEFKVDGMGTLEDLDKRHRLENLMDEVLGWTGLGHSDGGNIGSGTMEVSCLVADFNIARDVIESELKDTEFADYARIYNENAGQN